METFYRICDTAFTSVEERFAPNEHLMKDCACLDPKRFEEIKKSGLPDGALKTLAENTGVCKETLSRELKQFATHYKDYFKNLKDASTSDFDAVQCPADSGTEDEWDENKTEDLDQLNPRRCKQGCIHCAFTLLYELTLNESTYSNLYCVYKYVMTLPTTQVTCERLFSKLKIIKSKLRSLLGQSLLENLMLLNTEYVQNFPVDYDVIINEIAESSRDLKRLLML